MVTWLTRSLLFVVAGAVLAYAVTVHNDHIDLQTTGVILLLVGVFDLLLNFGLALYMRQPPFYDAYASPYPSGRHYPSGRQHPPSRQHPPRGPRASDRVQDRTSDPRPNDRMGDTRAYNDDEFTTRPIRRDHPDWH